MTEWVEITVGKGEIARYEQFLLFLQCFLKTCTAEESKSGLLWEGLICIFHQTETRKPVLAYP